MCVGRRNCDFSILSEHFQELCERSSIFSDHWKTFQSCGGLFPTWEGFVGLMVPAERSGALFGELYDVFQNCATFMDIEEHG